MFHAFIAAALAGFATAGLSSSVLAQEFPDQPITWVVPSSPGSGFDVVARIVTPKLSQVLGQSVVVQNIAGAGGTIGATEVATAKPDGYTILQININHTSAEALYNSLKYDLVEDFDPIIRFTGAYFVLAVNEKVGVETLDELIALAKEKPDELNFASGGLGSSTFMVGQSFLSAAGIEMTHIPYEGGGPAIASIVAGETDFYAAPYATVKPFMDEGKVRVLAITSSERVPFLPDMPAASESVPGYDLMSWYGLLAPAGTPPEVVERIHQAMVETLADPQVKQQLDDLGMESFDEGPEAFGEYLTKEIAIMKTVVEEAGIEPR